MGELVYGPPRDGPTLGEIGTPVRTAAEFYVPDPNSLYVNRLYVNHSDRKKDNNTYQGTTWQINFNLDHVNINGTYKLPLALASVHSSELQIRINNSNATSPPLFSGGVIGEVNTIVRHGIHALYIIDVLFRSKKRTL
ncbi:rhamnogalacturonan endolyase [Trifolium repens]|nr:rhamnogalacturonan endolyase [Trifolium repens]